MGYQDEYLRNAMETDIMTMRPLVSRERYDKSWFSLRQRWWRDEMHRRRQTGVSWAEAPEEDR